MNPIQKRFFLFLVGCIGTRSLLVYLAYIATGFWLKIMAIGAAIIATGFTIIYVGGLRTTGLETGGSPIWWNMLRPLHALLYALFAYNAWNGHRTVAWRILLADVLIGLTSFLYHHICQGNLKQLVL